MHHVNTHFSFRENVRYSKLLINHISDIRTTPESSEVTDIDFSNEQKKWLIKGLNDYKDKKYLDELKFLFMEGSHHSTNYFQPLNLGT